MRRYFVERKEQVYPRMDHGQCDENEQPHDIVADSTLEVFKIQEHI